VVGHKPSPSGSPIVSLMSPSSGSSLRLPRRTLEVFAAFLDDPDAKHYALELASALHITVGGIFVHLARLQYLGWITSGWDDLEEGSRYRRRWYRLSEEGRRNGRVAAKIRLRKRGRLGRLVPRWLPG
jgi:PadR family transcriptional regulator PadR